MVDLLVRFWRDEYAATAVEYSLFAALMSIAAMAVWDLMGTQIQEIYGYVEGVMRAGRSPGVGP